MKKQKLNPKQKIALERIYRLFEISQEMNKSNEKEKSKYVKRYLSLSKKISEKYKVSIPKELQKKYCKKCYSLNVNKIEKSPFLEVKCRDCGFIKKFKLA